MNHAAEVSLVVQRELTKNVRSAKGIVLLALSILGGVMAALVLAWLETKQRELFAGQLAKLSAEDAAAASAELQKQIALQLGEGDAALGELLAKIPLALLGAFKVSVWLAPALIALLGFDVISGELQHRTVRYWTVRTRRSSYYVGKVLGLWGVVSLLTLLVHVFVWAIVVSRGEKVGAVLEWGPRLWAVTLPLSLVWCAIAQLIASQFRQPILALLVTFGSFFVLWIAYLLGISGKAAPLVYLYPNYFDHWLLYPNADRVFEGLGVCAVSAAVYVAAGAAAFQRRDV